MKVFEDLTLDQQARSQQFAVYNRILGDRILRERNDFKSYMGPMFDSAPKHTLTLLQQLSNSLTDVKFKAIVDAKIENNDYCIEGSPEHAYSIAYTEKRALFFQTWPTQEETLLRQAEEAELLSLLI